MKKIFKNLLFFFTKLLDNVPDTCYTIITKRKGEKEMFYEIHEEEYEMYLEALKACEEEDA